MPSKYLKRLLVLFLLLLVPFLISNAEETIITKDNNNDVVILDKITMYTNRTDTTDILNKAGYIIDPNPFSEAFGAFIFNSMSNNSMVLNVTFRAEGQNVTEISLVIRKGNYKTIIKSLVSSFDQGTTIPYRETKTNDYTYWEYEKLEWKARNATISLYAYGEDGDVSIDDLKEGNQKTNMNW